MIGWMGLPNNALGFLGAWFLLALVLSLVWSLIASFLKR